MAKRGGNGLRAVLDGKSPLWKWSAPSEVDNGNGLRPQIDREINGLRPQAWTMETVCALKYMRNSYLVARAFPRGLFVFVLGRAGV